MLTDKLLTLAFGLVFLLMIACSDASETATQLTEKTPSVLKENRAKAAFLDYAASTNMLQIELARLAIERGQSEELKAMGKQAVEFHTKALANLRMAVGEAHHGSLPDSLGTADKSIVEEFKKLPAAEFDDRYRQYITSSHSAQLERYQEVLLRTEDEQIRQWISQVQGHLQERTQMADKAEISL